MINELVLVRDTVFSDERGQLSARNIDLPHVKLNAEGRLLIAPSGNFLFLDGHSLIIITKRRGNHG